MEKKNKINLLVRIMLVFVVSAAVLTAVVVASGLKGQDDIVTAGYTIEQTSPSDVIVTEQTTEATTSETTTSTGVNSDSQNTTKKPTKNTTKKTAKKTTKKTAVGTAAPTAAKTTAAPKKTTQKTTTRQTVATTTTLSNAQRESRMFNNINSYRKNHGAGGLSRVTSGPLYNAARKRLSEICSSFSHTRPNGSDFSTVLAEYGVSYTRAGENLGCGSLEGVYSGWISSSGHRKNIVNGAFRKSALVSTVSGGKRYWVQLFIN